MFSQENNTQTCIICNGTNFYKEAGYFFCSQCQTQNEEIREEVFDERYDPTTRFRKIKIKTETPTKTDVIGWTSWELYNFVLIGLSNELIEIGADPNVKLTILQLWTYYLSKLEVAFTSKTKKCVPKMARRYHKRDVEIIYGKVKQKRKRKRKLNSNTSASSMISSFVSNSSRSNKELNKSKRLLVASEYDKYLNSQASSDNDGQSLFSQSLHSIKSSISQSSSTAIRIRYNKKAKLETKKVKNLSKNVPRAKRKSYQKKHVTSQYAASPNVLTPLKLWSILYLALRINNQDIYLSDMLRFTREGHLSYHKLDHLLPAEIALTRSDVSFLTQTADITHKGMRRTVGSMAKFLDICDLGKTDFIALIKRYCDELALPRGIFLYAERLFLSLPSKMNFTSKSPLFPNYEGRAMAYIIVVLKTLFSLDDVTEKEINCVVDKINRIATKKELLTSKLFCFCEWQKFIECRKCVLTNLHFPSRLKYDPECTGTTHLYLRFMGWMKSKREGQPPEITNTKHILSPDLAKFLQECIDELNDNSIPLREMEMFAPSLTPLKSYVAQLAENIQYDIPNILRENFYETKIGYVTRPDTLTDLASQCGLHLEIIDRSLQFFEKIVPPFELAKLPSLKELAELVKVESQLSNDKTIPKIEYLLDYAHRNRQCKLKVNFEMLDIYSVLHNKIPEFEESLNLEEDCYFDRILPDGRLNICEESDSEEENTIKPSNDVETIWDDSGCLLSEEFCQKYNIKLYNHEIECLTDSSKFVKSKYVRNRDETGKFIKPSDVGKKIKGEKSEKTYKRIKNSMSDSSDGETSSKPKPKKQQSKKISKKSQDSEDEIVEVPIDCFDESDSDISILNDYTQSGNDSSNCTMREKELFFRPYKNYWMYHCIFSKVKGKNFQLFEKELPMNFVWLLNECANITEMTKEDLYEEVCLIEGYYLNILKSKESKGDEDYTFHNYKNKVYSNSILSKW